MEGQDENGEEVGRAHPKIVTFPLSSSSHHFICIFPLPTSLLSGEKGKGKRYYVGMAAIAFLRVAPVGGEI